MTSRNERARQRAAWRARREAELLDHVTLIRGLIDELAQDGRWTLETGRTVAGHQVGHRRPRYGGGDR